jgi:glutamate formiminotransferase/formiminotetrahydrofolate cyclodeaminase
MNLVDIERTSLATAYSAVEREARAMGLEVTWSEVIGLMPERAALDVASTALRLRDDLAAHVLERRLLATRTDHSLAEYIESVGDSDPFPGGGSVAGVAGALAAALVSMVAGVTIGRERYAAVDAEMREHRRRAQIIARELQVLAARDAEAYARVTDARRLPRSTSQESARRESAIHTALMDAIDVPLSVARLAAEVAELTSSVARSGNSHAITDAGVAALLARAACTGASYNVRVNALSLRDPADGDAAVGESIALAVETDSICAEVGRLVEAALQ